MKQPPIPPDEGQRLDALRRLHLLDSPREERFDRITRLAKRALGTEVAMISLIDEARQWFKSVQGIAATETTRDVSFCGHAIVDDHALVIADATKDGRFADNPLVVGGPQIRLYAGQPLHSPDGFRIGTLCVVDPAPRQLDAEDLGLLRDLAVLVENELRLENLGESERELRARLTDAERRAAVDSLTCVWNRGAIERLLENEVTRAIRQKLSLAVIMLDIDNFKDVNDTYGHAAGDLVLTTVADRLRACLRPYDSIGRYGGEEFVFVLTECDDATAATVAERLRASVADTPIAMESGPLVVTVSLGACVGRPLPSTTATELIATADRALYGAKAAGRDRVSLAPMSRLS